MPVLKFIPLFIIDRAGNTGPQATKFISFVNKVSGVEVADGAAGAGRKQVIVRKFFYVGGFCFSAISNEPLPDRMLSRS